MEAFLVKLAKLCVVMREVGCWLKKLRLRLEVGVPGVDLDIIPWNLSRERPSPVGSATIGKSKRGGEGSMVGEPGCTAGLDKVGRELRGDVDAVGSRDSSVRVLRSTSRDSGVECLNFFPSGLHPGLK